MDLVEELYFAESVSGLASVACCWRPGGTALRCAETSESLRRSSCTCTCTRTSHAMCVIRIFDMTCELIRPAASK